MEKIFNKIRTILVIINLKLKYKHKITFGKKIGLKKGVIFTIGENGQLKIGNEVFFNNYCSINCLELIEIDDGTILGEGVKIYDHNHKYKEKNIKIKDQGFNLGKIKIGKNCWIGSNVIILNNVSIGDNSIIGANCLIYKSIPENCIVKSGGGIIIEKTVS